MKLENLDNKEKLTKNNYFELVKNNTHYNIGTIWKKPRTNEYNLTEQDLINALNTKFLNVDYLKEFCLCCTGCRQNSVDFLHVKKDGGELLHEQKKGAFYIININEKLGLIIHEYKDTTETISFKVLIKN